MVIKSLKNFISKQKDIIQQRLRDKRSTENFRQTEDMIKAEEIKKEADRLAQLKQYKHSIEEYNKALAIYPLKGSEPELYRNAADFLFKAYYNIAACYSYLNDFEKSIEYFDKALGVNNTDEENRVKAYMGKGTSYYRKDDKKIEEYKKGDHKKNFIKLAHDCFAKATGLDKNNADAWYRKAHMEFLMDKIKDAVQSFDMVLSIDKNYENKEIIMLFDEIKKEKGILISSSEIMMREDVKPMYRTKTGHLVRNRTEMSIANFLYENSLMFQYNNIAVWADKDDFRSLFFIPKLDLYIEHFPYDYAKEYQKIMKGKVRDYDKHKKKIIYTTSADEQNIEEALKLKLKPYIVL